MERIVNNKLAKIKYTKDDVCPWKFIVDGVQQWECETRENAVKLLNDWDGKIANSKTLFYKYR